MALFFSLLSFCDWSFFPFFILHKCIECFFGGRLTALQLRSLAARKARFSTFHSTDDSPTEAYVTDFSLEKLELGHASRRLDFRYLIFFE